MTKSLSKFEITLEREIVSIETLCLEIEAESEERAYEIAVEAAQTNYFTSPPVTRFVTIGRDSGNSDSVNVLDIKELEEPKKRA